MGPSTTLGPGVPAHSRVGGCGPAAPYLQHCCYCVQPSPQCGSAPGPRHAGQCMRRRGGPQHGCKQSSPSPGPRRRLPRAGLLRAAAGSVLPLATAAGDRPARTGYARPRASNLPSSRKAAQTCTHQATHLTGAVHAWESHHNACNAASRAQVLGTEGGLLGVEQRETNIARCFGTFQSLAVSQEEEQELWHLRWTFSGRQDVSAWATSGARLYSAHSLPGPCPAHLSRFQCHRGCAADRASRRASGCRAQSRG